MEKSSTEWKRCTLADLGSIVTGKTPSTKVESYWNGDVHFVTPADIQTTKHIFEVGRCISNEGMNAVKGSILPKGSVCVSCIGNLGYVGMTTMKCVSNQQINSIIPSQSYDNDFVFYLMKYLWPEFKNFEGQSTALSILNKGQFSKIEVNVPSLPTQKRIASVLSSFDNAIENNQHLISNLLEQADLLFKSWFISFERWGGNRPTSWLEKTLGDFLIVKRGGSPRPIADYICSDGLNWLKISDVTSLKSPFVFSIKEKIKKEGLKKTVFMKKGSLVLSNSATPGIPVILEVDTCIHDGWLYFENSKLSNEFLYLLFRSIRRKLVSLGNGSVFTNLKTDIVRSFPVFDVPKSALKEFDSMIKPFFDMMLSKNIENNNLIKIRDSLLQKMMSGEIDVSKVKIEE